MRLLLALSLCAALNACAGRVRGEASSTVVVEEPGEFYYWDYDDYGHRVRRHRHRTEEESRSGPPPAPAGNPPPGRVTAAPPDPSPTPVPAPLVRVKAGLP